MHMSNQSVKNESLHEFNDYERILRSYSNEFATNSANPNFYIDGTSTINISLKTFIFEAIIGQLK